GLYGAPPPALPEEMRILGVSTSLAYFCIAIFLFLGRGEMPSRLVFLGAWLLSMGLVPLVRCQLRATLAHKPWWGVPTVLLGEGVLASRVEAYLIEHAEVGLRPQALFTPAQCGALEPLDDAVSACGLQRLEHEEDLVAFANRYRETCAVVMVARDATLSCRRKLIDMASQIFPAVILVPEDFADGEIPIWVRPLEIGSVLCLKVRQNLLDPRRLMLKRVVDLVLSLIGGTLLLPLFVLMALAIRLESPGSAFFCQERIGRCGKIIRILKFRTMVSDAEKVLQDCLANNPEKRKEWEADQKLRDDPRITRVGAFLRRTSLDELPQLWNVLCGEMSLVGPRPIVREEVERYGAVFSAYKRVRPGITGLWQVSGRNDLSYKE
ncbi:MAG: sugar transferase, partial [Bilophila sp.]